VHTNMEQEWSKPRLSDSSEGVERKRFEFFSCDGLLLVCHAPSDSPSSCLDDATKGSEACASIRDVRHTRPREKVDHRCVGNQHSRSIPFFFAQTTRLFDIELFLAQCTMFPERARRGAPDA
jgi:hypothetical protein